MATKPATSAPSMEDRIAIHTATGWRPEPGQSLERAEVIGFRTGAPYNEGDDPYPIVVYRTQEGEYVAIHVFHQVLRDEYKAIDDVKVGQFHNISYLGRKKGNTIKKDGEATEYELYFVEDADNPKQVMTDVPKF